MGLAPRTALAGNEGGIGARSTLRFRCMPRMAARERDCLPHALSLVGALINFTVYGLFFFGACQGSKWIELTSPSPLTRVEAMVTSLENVTPRAPSGREMALTKDKGPFDEEAGGTLTFDARPPQRGHVLYFEDSPKRVWVMFNGETVADSRRVKLLHETGYLPVYYFPEEDASTDLLEESDHTTYCPFKGDASYRSVRVGDRVAENPAWSYPKPIDSAPPLAGDLAFYWRMRDHWYEEDEEVFVHPRHPYHRIDVLDSYQRVKSA